MCRGRRKKKKKKRQQFHISLSQPEIVFNPSFIRVSTNHTMVTCKYYCEHIQTLEQRDLIPKTLNSSIFIIKSP